MFSRKMSFPEFCERMIGRSRQDVIRAAEQEDKEVDAARKQARGRGSIPIRTACQSYSGVLGVLLNRLKYDGPAEFRHERDEEAFRRLLESMK